MTSPRNEGLKWKDELNGISHHSQILIVIPETINLLREREREKSVPIEV